MRAHAVLLALVLALGIGLAGCGGDDGDEAADEAPPAVETGGAETDGDAGDDGGGEADGKQIFVANCGGCHTLADAGTSGTVGPSFEDFAPPEETVEMQVRNGGGGMPAFEGQLTDDEISAVAAYVAENAGGG